jgi:endonuclease-3
MGTAQAVRRGSVDRFVRIDEILAGAYGTPEAQLGNKDDPLDEAIYVILSFQTNLRRFSLTWSALRTAFPSWDMLERAPVRQIARVLREGGLQRQKARTLKKLLPAVRQVAGQLSLDLLRVKTDVEAERILLRLPGFSWKAARCVLLYSLRRDVFPVDGNTFRILKRLRILSASAVYRRRELHDAVQAVVPPVRRRSLHVNLVIHGQRICLPRAPRCSECALLAMCPREGLPSHAGASAGRRNRKKHSQQ